jgi:CrcB protein
VTWLYVAAGAAVGATLRFLVAGRLDGRVPWGTLLVNVAGSLLLGWLSGAAVGGSVAALLGAGFCGGLTTYSAFAVQAHERGPRLGAAYVAGTLAAVLAAAAAGYALAAR